MQHLQQKLEKKVWQLQMQQMYQMVQIMMQVLQLTNRIRLQQQLEKYIT